MRSTGLALLALCKYGCHARPTGAAAAQRKQLPDASLPDEFTIPTGTAAIHLQLGPNQQPVIPAPACAHAFELAPLARPDTQLVLGKIVPATLFAHWQGTAAFALCVDASPDIVRDLRARHSDRLDVAIVWRALANASGHVEFHINRDSLSSSIHLPKIEQKFSTWYTRTVSVPAGPVGEIIDRLPAVLPIEYVQTNVEGYDYIAMQQLAQPLGLAGSGQDRHDHLLSRRGVRLVVSEINANGYDMHFVANEFRHFDGLLEDIHWSWVACVAGGDHLWWCVEGVCRNYGSAQAMRVADAPRGDLRHLQEFRLAPAAAAASPARRMSVLTNLSRTIPLSKMRLRRPEPIAGLPASKKGSYMHNNGYGKYLYRWAVCAMAPRPAVSVCTGVEIKKGSACMAIGRNVPSPM